VRDTVRAKGSLIDFREHYIYTILRDDGGGGGGGGGGRGGGMNRARGSLRASCGRRGIPHRGREGSKSGVAFFFLYIQRRLRVYIYIMRASVRGSSKIRVRSAKFGRRIPYAWRREGLRGLHLGRV